MNLLPLLISTVSLSCAGAPEPATGASPLTPPSTVTASGSVESAASPVQQDLSLDEVKSIAEEAFVYGFPLVVGYGVMYEYAVDTEAAQYKAPFNQLFNTARVYTPADTAVQTPNSDTPYSFAWADLRAEPVVFSVPDVEEGRYFSVQLVDLYTFNYGYVGSRATGNQAGTYMIAGPGWDGEAPAGVDRVFRCETDFSFVIFRTQLFGADDLPNVEHVQSGFEFQTLSAFTGGTPPPAAAAIDWLKFDKARAEVDPYSYMAFMLQFCPMTSASEGEQDLRERLASLGIVPGQPFSLDGFSAEQKGMLVAGVKSGMAKIHERLAQVGKGVNGWRLGSAAGDREFFDGDWALRSAGSMAGIYGNSQAEAFYPFLVTDGNGNVPDCSVNDYTMTFAAGQLPPVKAFWSITMYDAKTQFLIDNPLDRYLINSPMLDELERNEDGSLTIYIQKDSPGKDKESNWLPAPDGPIFIAMRLYWPAPEALDGTWTPPAVLPVKVADASEAGESPDKRPGEKSAELIIRTDERYGHDGLFQGPRGWTYWNGLENPRPIQNPNLWPEKQSTYFIGRFELPAGSELTWSFEFPHARYFQFALYRSENNTFVSTGEYFSGAQIEPDAGSTNPFRVGADRHAIARNGTLRIVAQDAPEDAALREPNTLYAGADGGLLQGVIRIYLSDEGFDGTGWGPANSPSSGPAFRYSGTLADGTQLSKEDVVREFAVPFEGATGQPVNEAQWLALVNAPTNDPALDAVTAPARPVPVWEKYWNIKYSILGAFKTPAERARIPFAGPMDGGGDPTTQYFLTHISRAFGPVYVMRGKLPTFPDTWAAGDGSPSPRPETEVQYWSIVSCEAAPSGQIVDGLCDMQIPLDENRNFVIVVSRKEDRPANATAENGVAWLEWSSRGEGLDDPRNREDFGMLMIRIMATNQSWKERPDLVVRPGMEAEVMGPYLPRGEYTDKAGFEALGSLSNH